MKEYTISDLYIGLNHSFQVTITNEMVTSFMKLTGDLNPLHTDKSFALSLGYKDQVVYGMLTNSFYSTLVGMYIPGKFALLQSVDAALVAPVFIGDTLTIYGEVKTIYITYKQIDIRAYITNQQGVKVSRAKIKAGING